jgi:hypothetical protein
MANFITHVVVDSEATLKVRLGDLKQVIREEYLRGVPEFVLRQATTKYVDEIRKHIFQFILANKSTTGVDQRESFAAANQVLEDLEEKANDLLEDQLFQFIRSV